MHDDALFHPWSQAEFGLNVIGLWLAVTGRYRWLAAIMLAASLNRETSFFLVLALILGLWPIREARPWVVAYATILGPFS